MRHFSFWAIFGRQQGKQHQGKAPSTCQSKACPPGILTKNQQGGIFAIIRTHQNLRVFGYFCVIDPNHQPLAHDLGKKKFPKLWVLTGRIPVVRGISVFWRLSLPSCAVVTPSMPTAYRRVFRAKIANVAQMSPK